MQNERGRPDSADLVVAGCGWLLIVAVISLPGILLNDGALTTYMAVVGGLIGFLWARGRLHR
ncbi:hypothetical protein FSY75_05405 [Streptomyces sp. TR1341]|uniref:hypothetical protein n=1 Tax=Streptomyces TaxID=1883 RepID=UPI000FFED319|nr:MULTISPECIES: hypothetical protein [Streptomyces]NDK23920.1 hypothetical protein [Streptomyces sp. TR1341]